MKLIALALALIHVVSLTWAKSPALKIEVKSNSGSTQSSASADWLKAADKKIQVQSETDSVVLLLDESYLKDYPVTLLILTSEDGSTSRTLRFKKDTLILKKQPAGIYKWSIALGGEQVSKPQTWSLGIIDFSFPQVIGSMTAQDQMDALFLPLPEIHHEFRPDPKMPPLVISLTFSGLVLSPWLILLYAWTSIGVNVKRIGKGFTWNVSFLGGLTALSYILYLYWVRLNLFQTLGLMIPLGVITAYLGKNVLSVQASQKNQ